jgi:hypothetical protein
MSLLVVSYQEMPLYKFLDARRHKTDEISWRFRFPIRLDFVLDSPIFEHLSGMISKLGLKTADEQLRGFMYRVVDLPRSMNQPCRFYTVRTYQ